jgi:acyl-CoA thioesterase FadM
MLEKDIKHDIKIDISMYNSNGDFVPSAYQRMIMSMIEEHLDLLKIGEKELMESYGISWVLLSSSIEFSRSLHPSDQLSAFTWHAGGRIPSFRRDFRFVDAEGTTVAIGATVSTLFDNATRKLCLDRTKLSVIDLEPQDTILAKVDRKIESGGEKVFVETRRVRPSMTDGVGHVNNTKYADFVYDAMTREEAERLCDLSRMDIWFNYELREGDEFDLYKYSPDENTLCFCGIKHGECRSSFDLRLKFRIK